MNSPPIFTVKLLQVPSLSVNGQTQMLRSKKGEALLYYLVLEKKASRDKLAALIWENDSAESARRHLRDTIYLLRKQIGEVVVAADRYTLQLNPEYHFQCDVEQLTQNQNISVYQGEFLQDFHMPDSTEYENWVELNREKFRSAYLSVLSEQIRRLSQAEDLEKLEEYLRLYLQEDSTAEHICVQLMELYRQREEYGNAAAIYQRLRKTLSEEMGISPLKNTAALYYDIMEEWNSKVESEKNDYDRSLLNRQMIYSDLEASLGHSTRAVVVSGDPGVGKSYMLKRLRASAQFRPYLTVTTTCYKSKRDTPLYPWQAIVSGLRRFATEEDLVIPDIYHRALIPFFPALSGGGDTSLFPAPDDTYFSISIYECLSNIIQIVTRKKPLLLILEDIHWIDQASLDLLDSILHTPDGNTLLVLATCQPPFPDSLSGFLEAAQKDHILFLRKLPAFTYEETLAFIDRYGGGPFSEQMKRHIYNETKGNAFLLIQLLGYLKEHIGDTAFHLDIESQITFRTNGLDQDSRQLLNMIAMFQEYAPYDVLCQLSGKLPVELLPVCRELMLRMLVSERNDGGHISLILTQPEYRDYLYGQLSSVDRQIMHRSIVNILETSFPDFYDRDMMLEYHYAQCGDRLNAFRHRVNDLVFYISNAHELFRSQYGRKEFEQATDLQIQHIIAEAENTLNQLCLAHVDSSQLDEIRNMILYIQATYGTSTGHYTISLPAIHELLFHCGKRSNLCIIAHRQMANYAIQIGNTDLLKEHINAGQACAMSQGSDREYAVLERYRGLLYIMEGNYPQARETLHRSLELTDQAYAPGISRDVQSAYVYDYIGDSYRKEGQYERACEEYATALRIIEHHHYVSGRPIFHTNTGWALLGLGRYREARENFEIALQKYSTLRSSFAQSVETAFMALFACAERDYPQAVGLLQLSDKKGKQFQSPRDRNISLLVKAVLRKRCDMTGEDNELSKFLSHPFAYYASEAFLYGNMGVFEKRLLNNLFSAKQQEEDILLALWNGI